MSYTERLFTLFDDVEVNWDAARAIGGIVKTDKVLTKQNHAVVKVNLSPNVEEDVLLKQDRRFSMHRSSSMHYSRGSWKVQKRLEVRLPFARHHLTSMFGLLLVSMLPDSNRKNAYLVALTSLIKAIPKTTYAHELHIVSRRKYLTTCHDS